MEVKRAQKELKESKADFIEILLVLWPSCLQKGKKYGAKLKSSELDQFKGFYKVMVKVKWAMWELGGVRLLRVMPVINLNHQDNKMVGNIRQVDGRQLTIGSLERDAGERAAGI